MEFAERFEAALKRAEKKQKDINEDLGIKSGVTSGWKKRGGIGKMYLKEVADYLDVDTDYLLGNQDEFRKIDSRVLDNNEATYPIIVVNPSASAGTGSEIYGIEEFDSNDILHVAKELFKLPPSKKLRAIKVNGFSMMPMLPPDSWCVFNDDPIYRGEGLYIVNSGDMLLVKLVWKDDKNFMHVDSVADGYPKLTINPEDQTHWHIVGKVVRAVI